MKAIRVVPSRKRIEVADMPEPALRAPGDVDVRTLEVGICGTDKEIARFEYGEPPPNEEALIIGHEALGEVVAVGDAVEGLRPGDLVVPMVRRPCPHASCLACRNGHQDFCYTGDYVERGIKQAHGFLTERIVDDARYMVRVPQSLRSIAVLTEPLTIAEKALAQVWHIQERLPWACRNARAAGQAPPLRALVLGAGPVGLLGAMLLRHEGFETVVYSREPRDGHKARLVERFGGRYVSAQDYEPDALLGAIERVDLVYEAIGASQPAFDVLRVLGPNAVFVFTGVPGRKCPVEIAGDAIMRDVVINNQLLFGTVNAGREAYDAAVTDLATFAEKDPEGVQALITGRYPMEDAEAPLSGEAGGIKNVVVVDREHDAGGSSDARQA